MVFTYPPYAVNYEKKSEEILGNGRGKGNSIIKSDSLDVNTISEKLWLPAFINLFNSAKDDCCYYMTMCQGGDQMMMMMMMMNKSGWQVKHELIWVKSSPVFSMGRLDYDYKHEPIIYGWKKKHNFYGKGNHTKSVWEIAKPSKSELHPTMKPIALIENALLNSTLNDNLVIDFFGGSGSTLIACEQLNRKCYMMELDEKYCDVIIKRWETLTGQTAEKLTE
jgi:DNA modification methylase